jgi:hypothetical protein
MLLMITVHLSGATLFIQLDLLKGTIQAPEMAMNLSDQELRLPPVPARILSRRWIEVYFVIKGGRLPMLRIPTQEVRRHSIPSYWTGEKILSTSYVGWIP